MRRLPQLDGLRGIAVLMVFLYHAFGANLLWAGVDLFFVMSGYLITGILLRLSEQAVKTGAQFQTAYWRPFYVRRARRILPPYFLFLLCAALYFPLPWRHVWPWYAFFGANIEVAMTGLAIMPMVPLWSLAVEEQFYLVWPFVLRVVSVRLLKRIALGIILVAPVLRAVFTPLFHTYWPIYTLTFFRADTLAWGAWIAVCEHERPAWLSLARPVAGISAVITSAILVSLSAFAYFRRGADLIPFNALGYSLIGLACGALVMHVLGSTDGWLYRILTEPALRYLGKVSYTFYLFHFSVLLAVGNAIHSRTASATVAFLISIAIASISWFALESPLLNRSAGNQGLGMVQRTPDSVL